MAVQNTLAPKKLTADMGIVDLIKNMEPEIKKALPSVMTPERFMRMALSATNMSPKLLKCEKMTFLSALMSAAQLGLEPNTPLGQAYLIPYWSNKRKRYECQFQIGYQGYKDLFYRNESNCNVDAYSAYENDLFSYELGLNPNIVHKPALTGRGKVIAYYSVWKSKTGGFGISVMSAEDMENFFKEKVEPNKKGQSSPWDTDYEAMAKKTVLKRNLKYAPLNSDIRRLIMNDETVKNGISVDMSEIADMSDENIVDGEFMESEQEAQQGAQGLAGEQYEQQSFAQTNAADALFGNQ